jgi:hypothetical protein
MSCVAFARWADAFYKALPAGDEVAEFRAQIRSVRDTLSKKWLGF